MSAELSRLRASYACAPDRHKPAAFIRMQDRLHDELRHELCLRASMRRTLIELNQTRMTLKALRDTMAFGG